MASAERVVAAQVMARQLDQEERIALRFDAESLVELDCKPTSSF